MRTFSSLRTAILLVLFIALALGIYRLFTLRFEAGDIYPPYSSLRTDPLGCKAFYDALDLVPGIKVQRHYLDLENMIATDGDTVFLLGMDPAQLKFTLRSRGEKIISLAEDGSRIIVALRSGPLRLHPEEAHDGDNSEDELDQEDNASPGEEEPGETVEPGIDRTDEDQFDDKWGVRVDRFDREEDLEFPRSASIVPGSANLPESIPVYTELLFLPVHEEWRIIYEVDGHPVLLERAFGSGAVVLLSDSYLLSNEALRAEFNPELLSWLMADGTAAVFDESHLGVFESPGVMSLVRKYRLDGFLVALVVLVLLAAWKSSVPLVRVRDRATGAEEPLVTEKDQFSGLVNLLRRNIGSNMILQACSKEWSKSFGKKRSYASDSSEDLMALIASEIIPRGKKDIPAGAYNRITKLLAERKG